MSSENVAPEGVVVEDRGGLDDESQETSIFDSFLPQLLCLIIAVHAAIAPYTKVEESFNIQAVHDILSYSSLPGNYFQRLRFFDHIDFPGAVPRTFVGALALAGLSKPLIALKATDPQLAVRAVLGLLNSYALLSFKDGLTRAYGRNVGIWYFWLQASQFHVIYYASRTLPNMFAFGLTTIALAQFLPAPNPKEVEVRWRQNLGVFLFVFAAVVFRSEVALLLAMQLLHLLMIPRMSLQQIVPTGIKCALIALLISIPIDSFFWQKPLWPELWGFYYNAIQGKASDWGTSRYPHYFSSLLPRLLLNPLIMILLIPLSLSLPAIQRRSLDLVVPSFLFIAVYSLQPHKESRFIIYVVPPLTGAAALSASFIWTRRSKTLLYRLGSLLLVFSILASFAASTLMLFISSLNYPGGEAITSVRNIMNRTTQWPEDHNDWERIYVHMDVLSCMTGVTRFQEIPSRTAKIAELPIIAGVPTYIVYDKEENKDKLLDPAFWEQFDYALMEEPGKAIGKWEVVDTIYGLAGMEILRPGQGDGFEARLYAANSVPRRNGVMDSEDVREAADEPVDLEAGSVEEGSVGMESLIGLGERLLSRDVSRYAKYSLVKDIVRSITGGYWIGPRMEPAIRILKRVKDSSTSS